MKLRWIIMAGLALAGACGLYSLVLPGDTGKTAVTETRLALRQRGFKTDLADFNFSTSDELRERAAALTNASSFTVPGSREESARRSMVQQIMPQLLQPVGSDAAIPLWKQGKLAVDAGAANYFRQAGFSSDDVWTALRESFNDDREVLDAACMAALAGPIQFNLVASHGKGILLPHVMRQ